MKLIEFRDGERDVVDHVAVMMAGMKTWEYTYEQALHLAEQKLLTDRLKVAQDALVREHFRKRF